MGLFSPKIVKFGNNKYGVRVGNWLTGYKFVDFVENGMQWTIDSQFIDDCQTDALTASKYISKIRYTIIGVKDEYGTL